MDATNSSHRVHIAISDRVWVYFDLSVSEKEGGGRRNGRGQMSHGSVAYSVFYVLPHFLIASQRVQLLHDLSLQRRGRDMDRVHHTGRHAGDMRREAERASVVGIVGQ